MGQRSSATEILFLYEMHIFQQKSYIFAYFSILLTFYFSQIGINLHAVSLKKIRLKTSSTNFRSFRLGLNILNDADTASNNHIVGWGISYVTESL